MIQKLQTIMFRLLFLIQGADRCEELKNKTKNIDLVKQKADVEAKLILNTRSRVTETWPKDQGLGRTIHRQGRN